VSRRAERSAERSGSLPSLAHAHTPCPPAGDDLAQPPAGFHHSFTDVDPVDDEAVNVAVFNDLVSGKTATLFAPYEVTTRSHTAEIRANTLKIVE